jgi:hypothetical protein
MTWQKKIADWRKLKPAERKARGWADVPHQVAASMAFEGELVKVAAKVQRKK